MPEVKPNGYTPQPRLGRPPAVNIDSFHEMVIANPGQWVGEIYTEAQAASAKRQFQKLGYQVMTSKCKEPNRREVLVRWSI